MQQTLWLQSMLKYSSLKTSIDKYSNHNSLVGGLATKGVITHTTWIALVCCLK
jgi:hypothetical protein